VAAIEQFHRKKLMSVGFSDFVERAGSTLKQRALPVAIAR